MTSSAYGLDSGPELDWRQRGACAQGQYPADWWVDATPTNRGRAVWVCLRECPVRAVCGQWADENREMVDRAVYGGVYWCRASAGSNRTGQVRPSTWQPTPIPPRGLSARPVNRLDGYADRIGRLLVDGWSLTAIAAEFGCATSAVQEYLRRASVSVPLHDEHCGQPATSVWSPGPAEGVA